MRKWLLPLVAVSLGGCAAEPRDEWALTKGVGGTARLTVQEDHREGKHGEIYIEGARQFVEVRRPGVREPEVRAEIDEAPRALALPRGTYTIVSYTRTCSGSCDRLDAPSFRCRKRQVRVAARHELVVRTRVGKPCVIR